jgi:spore germination cell wall hydrolase CwlJ-like protein
MCEAWDQDHFADVGKMVEPDPQEVEYLAIVIFCEVGADAQSDETRYMVGDVVLNRVADSRFPNTIYEVLTQRAQYGRFYWTDVVWPERASYAGNAHAVERARRIAYDLLTDAYHSKLYGQGYIYQDNRVHGKDNIWSDGVCFGR